MPSDERPARRGADLTLTAGVLVAVFASLLPLMRVVRPSSWLLGAIVLSVRPSWRPASSRDVIDSPPSR